jgi:Zn ribbon nucleic-acid-binding protein
MTMNATETTPGVAAATRYCELDWNSDGAVCSTNIAGMKCPRCQTPLAIDVEHKCGGALRPLKKKIAEKRQEEKKMVKKEGKKR